MANTGLDKLTETLRNRFPNKQIETSVVFDPYTFSPVVGVKSDGMEFKCDAGKIPESAVTDYFLAEITKQQ